jgi:hypothetical protein
MKEQTKVSTLFTIAFALCISGLVAKFEPEYLTTIINILGMEVENMKEYIGFFASFQILIGSILLFISSMMFKKNNEKTKQIKIRN